MHEGDVFPLNVSVAGLGKLGACTAACIASKGHNVIGIDLDERAIAAVNRGEAPVIEPGLDELMAACSGKFSATADYREAVLRSDLTLVIVPTPSEESGRFSTRLVTAAAKEIGAAIGEKDSYHVVSLTSTVLPGDTTGEFIPALEGASGRECGPDFGVCYSPEFIALGSVIRDFFNPDFVLIGESDSQAGDAMARMYASVCDNDPPVQRIGIVNAELAKIAINTYVTTKITFANMLGEICGRLPGADVDAVTAAIGLDSRIGRKYLKAGLGYGGPCFPRDNSALAHLARSVGAPADIPEATDRANRGMADRLVAVVAANTPDRGRVAVLGLSYKPDSWVVEESQSLEVARRLSAGGYDVSVHDPLALDAARSALGDSVTYTASMGDCVAGADTVLIANPDPAFAGLGPDDLVGASATVVIDGWRMHGPRFRDAEGLRYIPIGVGPKAEADGE